MAETFIKDIGKKERKPKDATRISRTGTEEGSMKDRNTATTVIPVIIRSQKKGPFLKIEYLISTIDMKKVIPQYCKHAIEQ